MKTNSFLNVSNRLRPSATAVEKSIDIPQFSASAPTVVELMDKTLLANTGTKLAYFPADAGEDPLDRD